MIYVLPPYHDEDYTQYPEYEYTLELDGDEYRFVIRWFERSESWFVTIYDADDTALLINAKMTVNAPFAEIALGRRLILVDTTGENTEATFLSLGKTHQLMWLDQDDLDYIDAQLTVSYEVYAPSGEEYVIPSFRPGGMFDLGTSWL